MKKVRVRYAPSPTGHLHIGNARTALFNYLFAKHYNGDFVLRIEDTDIARNVEGGEASQIKYLNWLGIYPDESPQNPNPKYAPYRQMERLDIYKKYTDWLLEKGYAYKCFCTQEELDEEHARQEALGLAPRYNRKCCNLTPEEIKEKEAQNIPYTIRIKVPDNETYEFDDMIRGKVSFESKDIGDWVLVKANGIPTYNYAVVIDDHCMDITHVFRGEEHLSNTPKQIMLYKMFGWDVPRFGHMTLIVNENHKKLSKRDANVLQFMSQYEQLGYLPEAMFNFMALLGWSPEGEQEIFSHDELIKEFDEHRLSKSPSMFDQKKLTWINNRYIKAKPLDEIVDLCLPHLQKAYDLSDKSTKWIRKLIQTYQEQLSYGAEIVDLVKMFFNKLEIEPEAMEFIKSDASIKNTLKVFKEQIENLDDFVSDKIFACIKETQKLAGVKGKLLYMPIRIATTGIMHGPDLPVSLELLGKQVVIERLNDTINIL